MTLERLDKLVETRLVNQEPPDQEEFDGLIERARRHLNDAQVVGVSEEGQFSLTRRPDERIKACVIGVP
jgi:hypothetical protein